MSNSTPASRQFLSGAASPSGRLERHFRLLVIVDIDDCPLPLAGWNMTIEQDINFAVRSVLHLWEPDPSHDCAEKGSAGPDVTALATKVSLVRVEHVAGQEDTRNVGQVVGTPSDTSRQWPEPDGRRLSNDDP